MKRSISAFALLLTSISAILGSGWLFATYYTSTFAGPAAIVSWLIGGGAVVIIAFVFAELSAMLPITGSSIRIPHYTHGNVASFIFSWIVWLCYMTLTPTEVQAVIQYLSFFFPSLLKANAGLTHSGYFASALLMLGFSIINIFSLRWLLHCNNFLTVLKIAIPIIISIIIISLFFSPHHIIHPANSAFAPHGIHGIFSAIATGGILYAFNGFKQACELAGEAKNPHRALPFAILGSIITCLLIYLLLQFAFLSSLNGANLADGWKHLILRGGFNSPMASILSQDHLSYLLVLLYIGAIAGPLAAGLVYTSSAGRLLYAMSRNNNVSTLFQKINGYGNPAFAISLNFILGMCMFMPLPGWKKMIAFMTSLIAITYAIGPIALLALRYQLPDLKRPFKLPFALIWSSFAFYICSLLIYLSGWNMLSKLGIALGAGLIALLFYQFFGKQKYFLNWRESIWMWVYFIGLILISYLGNFGHGHKMIPFGWDFACIAILCMLVLGLALKFKLPSEKTKEYINELHLPKET